MAGTLNITTERVDDIPLLLAQFDRMRVQPLMDILSPSRQVGGPPSGLGDRHFG